MKFLDRLSDAYYKGEPLVSNEVFDELAKKYNYNAVGTKKEREIRHNYPLKSLQKVYPEDKAPFEGGVYTPKLDGAAVSLFYSNGKLVWAATRGDGIKGQDVTDKLAYLVPSNIEHQDAIQIDGEVVTLSSVENSRNYASGALNLKDLNEFKTRELYFFAYEARPFLGKTYVSAMTKLYDLGFRTTLELAIVESLQDSIPYPTDGKVLRIDSYKEFEAKGSTSKFPKGAYAKKENKKPEVTTLLDIQWQVGRSGVVSPVAIVEPVDIEGALVSRATLHNWAYIKQLNLEPNCKVEIIRAGEIIPRIIRRVDD